MCFSWICKNPNSIRRNSSCYCEANCDIYGDCCIDSEYFTPSKQFWGASLFKCIFLAKGTFYVKTSCPPDWRDDDTTKLCQSNLGVIEDIILDVPVTSSRTNITYLNGHCAICHQDFDAETDLIWGLNFECRINFEFFEEFRNSMHFGINNGSTIYLDGYFIEPININENSAFDKADPFFENISDNNFVNTIRSIPIPTERSNENPRLSFDKEKQIWKTEDSRYICDANLVLPEQSNLELRSCNPKLIADCQGNWTDETIRQKCLSYTDVWCHGLRHFRNPYCAFCNNVQDFESQYCNIFHYSSPGILFRSESDFSILLDWSSLKNKRKCSNGGIYDSMKGECRSISNIKGGKCLLIRF